MASLTIVTREAKDGPRYVVRFRLGGRAYPVGPRRVVQDAEGGEGPTRPRRRRDRRRAESRRRCCARSRRLPRPSSSVNTWAARFLASRIDVDANTKKNYASALRKIGETFGDRDPSTITATEIAEWIADPGRDAEAGDARTST